MYKMQVGLYCLIWYGRITNYCSSLSETCKTHLRAWLGPAPQSYQILRDGRVVPSTMAIPHILAETSYQYNPGEELLQQTNSTAQARRLSWIAVTVEEEDLSDWIQSLRWSGQEEPSLPALITLWAMIHHCVFPLHTVIHGVKNTAEEVNMEYH
jgi:hypothetical protein